MTTYTKAQLRNRVLQELGVLAGAETANADDAALVDAVIEDQHAMLDREILVTWSTSAIPDTVMEPLVLLVAARCAGRFGLPADRRQELLLLHDASMSQLRVQTAADTRPGATIPAVYY
jgi:hypothetical protein